LWGESDGVFDPTAGVLRQIWDFQSNSIGDPARLPEVLELVGFEEVSLNHEGVLLKKTGMELDLGGIGKEYAADVAASLILEAGFTRGLVDLAGDIVALGENHLGKPWDIGIRDPVIPKQSLLTVRLENAAIATSGGYYRTLRHGPNQVSHLLDPRTGLPVKGPSSVSVVASHCLIAGAVSTVACLQPIDTAREWLERSGLDWLMIAPSGDVTGPLLERSRIPL
jgi:thiamine biosynthesis lipoprotein